MSNYVYTDSGRMNIDEDDLRMSQFYIDMIIYDLRLARKQGGFKPADVRHMIDMWFRLGQFLRTPDYPRYYFLAFIRDADPPPAGKKASDILMTAMSHLDGYPMTSAADIHAVYFNQAEKAMITFISEYRKQLKAANPAELKEFVAKIIASAQAGHI